MQIGVVRETRTGETRVAATPTTVRQLSALGYTVAVEAHAGELASFSDDAYLQAGASVVSKDDSWASDVVLKVNAPSDDELSLLVPDATLICFLSPGLSPYLLEALASRRVTALAMDAVPRISRAQSLDALSSMANIAGYRSVIEAAAVFGRFFTGQITAAGKVPPAKVLVAGVGVAGLAAIGTASSLGAIVRATDPRPEVADQVRSVGGEYLAVGVVEEMGNDGYARSTSEEYDRLAAQIYAEQARDVDIIITTALIPGRPAPRLITEADVASMRSGSVVVDMAAAQGGNVAGSVPGEKVVTSNGVTIIGYTDLAARLPTQASQLYGTNLVNLMKLLTPHDDGVLVLDFDDVVLRSMTVTRDGHQTWPPPPVPVQTAPAGPKEAARHDRDLTPADPSPWKGRMRGAGFAAMAGVLLLVAAIAPAPLPAHLTVLMLSVVIGYYVIGSVNHALHTPLMSVTNAISGIIVVGAMLQVASDDDVVAAISFVAIALASINIFGGFSVTRRMLTMFSK